MNVLILSRQRRLQTKTAPTYNQKVQDLDVETSWLRALGTFISAYSDIQNAIGTTIRALTHDPLLEEAVYSPDDRGIAAQCRMIHEYLIGKNDSKVNYAKRVSYTLNACIEMHDFRTKLLSSGRAALDSGTISSSEFNYSHILRQTDRAIVLAVEVLRLHLMSEQSDW